MTEELFNDLLQLVCPYIHKLNTNYREAIPDEQRLAICLRFLATGDAFSTIGFSYRVGASTVSSIVVETCEAIWLTVMHRYMPIPNDVLWKDIANEFLRNCNFPNCLGAIDGKHVIIQAPANTGSLFYNYKGTFSVVLMAIVDSKYNFVAIDVGSYGSDSDGGILSKSAMGKSLEKGKLHVPPPKELPDAAEIGPQPHVLVGDEALPLKSYLLRSSPGKNLGASKRIFNYRLSRARRMVENAFCLLTQRWRIYQRRLQVQPDKAVKIITATCVLNNFIQMSNLAPGDRSMIMEIGDSDGEGENTVITNVPMFGGNRPTAEATLVREVFKDYFWSPVG